MSEQKLDQKLDQVKIEQTRPIRFKDEAINKIKKQNIVWDKKTELFIPFIVSKDSHQKGLKLRVYKGPAFGKDTKKVFYVQYWFNGRAQKYRLGDYSQRFGVRECDEELIKIYREIYKKYGKTISQLKSGAEILLKDMETDINVPVVLQWDGKEFDMISKTVMRKKNFKSSTKKYSI